jgi:hypothetical protein
MINLEIQTWTFIYGLLLGFLQGITFQKFYLSNNFMYLKSNKIKK